MNFTLDKIFAGVIDFFAILLPGSLLAFFLQGRVESYLFGDGKLFSSIPGTYESVVFIVAAFILGHLVDSIGAWLLDKYYYDKGAREYYNKNFDLTYLTALEIKNEYLRNEQLKERIFDNNEVLRKLYEKHVEDSEKGNQKQVSGSAGIMKVFFRKMEVRKNVEKAIQNPAPATNREHFKNNRKIEIINTYQWTKRVLLLSQPEALAEVNRLEADQKFFRSLVIATIIIAVILIAEGAVDSHLERLLEAAAFLILSFFSLMQFGKYRFRNTERAYQFLIAMKHGAETKKEDQKEAVIKRKL